MTDPTGFSPKHLDRSAGLDKSSATAPGGKLFGLQMLRAVAALMVVYSHLIERIVLRGFLGRSAWWLNDDIGRYGVCIFFAISGFVMFHAHWRQFGARDFQGNAMIFLKKRVARIYPMYFICTIIFVPFLYFSKHEFVKLPQLIESLLFITYKNDIGIYQPVYGLGWSLNYEMFFYLILALALYFSVKNAAVMVCCFIGCLIAVGIALGGDPSVNYHSDIAWSYTRPIMLFFIAGVLARTIPLHGAETQIARYKGFVIALAVVAGCLGLRTASTEWISAICTFVLVRIASLYLSYERVWARAQNAVEFLGDASYSLYLTHSFVLGVVTIALSHVLHSPVLAIISSLVLGLAIAVAFAALIYIHVERPLVRYATRWLLKAHSREKP